MPKIDSGSRREATCGCGHLIVETHGEPLQVYACSCLNCQRESGSAFTYGAAFPKETVKVSGERKSWRRTVDSGRWLETDFCPRCGVTVAYRMEAWPEAIGVPVGCFADPGFAKPTQLYWAQRLHHWLELPKDVELVEGEPD